MEYLALFLIASLIVGASKGGLASAGSLAVPLLSIWMDPLVAAGLLLPVFILSDLVGVWLYRREFSARNVMLLIPAGFVGVCLATVLAPYVSATLATFLTGLIGLFYCAQVVRKRLRGLDGKTPFHPVKGAFWGALAGMTSFISHTGAPPFQSFVLPQKLPKMEYAGTNTLVFAAINLFKFPAYASVGMLTDFRWPMLIMMVAVASVGAVLGKLLAQRLPEALYYLIIQILLFVISSYLVIKALIHFLG